jgi:ribosome-associated toxin RatA of RatAB toxin-antitoxin module
MIIERSLIIAAPVEWVYDVSQDYSVRYEWDPFPERISLLDGADEIEPGVKVCVKARSGLEMEVEFVQVRRPTVAAISMTKGPTIIGKFAGSWIFDDQGNGATLVRFRYLVKMKNRILHVLLAPFARLYFGRVISLRIRGLQRYCESHIATMTGRAVSMRMTRNADAARLARAAPERSPLETG